MLTLIFYIVVIVFVVPYVVCLLVLLGKGIFGIMGSLDKVGDKMYEEVQESILLKRVCLIFLLMGVVGILFPIILRMFS